MKKLISTNPANNFEIIGEVNISTNKEIIEKVEFANKAKTTWKELGLKERIKLITPICEEFKQRKNEIAKLITKETGKTIRESIEEVEDYLEEINWSIKNIEKAIKDETTFEDEKVLNKIIYEPIGVVALITPWNFPFGISISGIISNLLVGNTVVFKISEECPLLGKLIEEIINNANLPKGVFSEIYGDGKVGQKLVEEKIDHISFTGSTKVGKKLYKIASKKFIKVNLEMGGSSPNIVFNNINLDEYIETIFSTRFYHNGQVCDAIKRLIVHEDIFDEVVEKLKKLVLEKNILNSSDKNADFGSLVSEKQKKILESQFQNALDLGAKLIVDKKIPEELNGAYFGAKILTNISKNMKVWKQETFGPILPVIKFKTEKEAVKLANDTIYGLGARVISSDLEQAKRVALQIEAGTVEINNGDRWISENPFGGYKMSGIGRGNGIIGLRELCQIKVISMSK